MVCTSLAWGNLVNCLCVHDQCCQVEWFLLLDVKAAFKGLSSLMQSQSKNET